MIAFWLIITALTDLFRRHDLSGWGKVGWIVVLLLLPVIGALVYVIGQGRAMATRDAHRMAEAQKATDAYIRSVAAPEAARLDEIARAKELLDRGAISQQEFDQLKRRVLV
jgi:hypothetical protein